MLPHALRGRPKTLDGAPVPPVGNPPGPLVEVISLETRPTTAPAPGWRTVPDPTASTVVHHFPVLARDASEASQDDLTHSLARFVLVLWQARQTDASDG